MLPPWLPHLVLKLRSRRKLCSGSQASPGVGNVSSGRSGKGCLPGHKLAREPQLIHTGCVPLSPPRGPQVRAVGEPLQGPAGTAGKGPGPAAERLGQCGRSAQIWPRPQAPAGDGGDGGKGRGDLSQPPASRSRAPRCSVDAGPRPGASGSGVIGGALLRG